MFDWLDAEWGERLLGAPGGGAPGAPGAEAAAFLAGRYALVQQRPGAARDVV